VKDSSLNPKLRDVFVLKNAIYIRQQDFRGFLYGGLKEIETPHFVQSAPQLGQMSRVFYRLVLRIRLP
jgi:hypothetical protein